VANKRVNGQLAVSRALGDADFKNTLPVVSNCPEISEMLLQESDEFVVMGCDGLWDVMTSQEAVDFVRVRIKQGIALEKISSELVQYSINDRRSMDNVSVIIAKLVPAAEDGSLSQPSNTTTPAPGSSLSHPGGTSTAFSTPAAGMPSAKGGSAGMGSFLNPTAFQPKVNLLSEGKMEPMAPAAAAAAAAAAASADTRAASKPGGDLDTDEDLMNYLLDDANFS